MAIIFRNNVSLKESTKSLYLQANWFRTFRHRDALESGSVQSYLTCNKSIHQVKSRGVPVLSTFGAGFRQTSFDAGVLCAKGANLSLHQQVVARLQRASGHAGRIFGARLVALHRAQLLAPPVNRDRLGVAFVRVRGQCRAQTLAIAPLVAGARVEGAAFQVRADGHL